ncbi:hypothetical protein [uncultured Litoreibacter sp.]|uniref:hypothetical protein n=1 Tax=uncultured Litoreibacter sp. TaxID=1392394 RepID=UPI00262439A8|nr:hypothetical protein [uncultured Litoreibacter sp.]
MFKAELESMTQPRRFQKERLHPNKKICWGRIGGIVRPDLIEPRATSMPEARGKLAEYLAQRDLRYAHLERFLSDHGVTFSETRKSVSEVNAFYANFVYANDAANDLHPMWYAFVWNYSLFLGDLMIKEAAPVQRLRWHVRDVSLRKMGESIRPKFVVGALRNKHADQDPTFTIHSTGYTMLTRKASDLIANGRFPDPYHKFERALDESLRHLDKANAPHS